MKFMAVIEVTGPFDKVESTEVQAALDDELAGVDTTLYVHRDDDAEREFTLNIHDVEVVDE